MLRVPLSQRRGTCGTEVTGPRARGPVTPYSRASYSGQPIGQQTVVVIHWPAMDFSRPEQPRHKESLRKLAKCFLLLSLASCGAVAEVAGIQIEKRHPYENGRSFASAGPYEEIRGVMRFTADPRAAANRAVVDIEHAPQNSRGLVEFEADFLLIKPTDPKRGNRALLFDVVNRGAPTTDRIFQTSSTEPNSSRQFLLERGFTILAIGWQHDIPARGGEDAALRVKVPAARRNGQPIRGLVAVEFTLAKPAETQLLSDRGHIPYEVTDPNAPGTQLRIRHLDGREEIVPREKWGFRGKGSVSMEGGFVGGRSYQVIYQSQDPPVTGLAYAGVRDGVSALRHGQLSDLNLPAGTFDRVLAAGPSQSGRFLRGFVHEGFNLDLKANRVFDGVLAIIAGGSRTTINYRFAQPSGNPGLFFPFTDDSQTDAETGESGGLLSALPPAARPKMMYLNTPSEYWRASNASLVHTKIDGSGEFPIADDTRLYVVAGTQHGPASWPVKKSDRELAPNPLNYRWVSRAVFVALDNWVAGKAEPPASRYPRMDRGELTKPENLSFPAIPGVTVPPSTQTTKRAKLPPDFRSEGPITILPPRPGSAYPQMVSRVDADGNETGGILVPELKVPLGTYMAWNQQFPGAKDMKASLSLMGGFVPFPRDEAERKVRKDPRPSLAARYPSREDFVGRTALAALELAREGYFLDQDIAPLLREVRRQYDDLAGNR